ncbi:MAG: hypothetical protein MJZ20_09515 [Bacteroidaceae bacterium]|nr:hypothetical protein [Bacteroidaceae bacterium]
MGNLFYEKLEKDYELGDAKEKLLQELAKIFNEEEYPEYREDKIFKAMMDSGLYEQVFRSPEVKYIG